MFSLFYGLWKYVFTKDEFRVLILGVDKAGKTVVALSIYFPFRQETDTYLHNNRPCCRFTQTYQLLSLDRFLSFHTCPCFSSYSAYHDVLCTCIAK